MPYLPYVIQDFQGGRSENNDRGVRGSFKGGYALDIHKQDNTLSCQWAMNDITPSGLGGLIKWFVPASDGTTYAFLDTGSIYARSGDGTWTFAYNDGNGEIKGASEWGLDDDNTYLFWATDTSVARVSLTSGNALPWTNATQNWKTNLDSADYHTMKQASGQLMIANGNYLASIDFNGNWDNAAVNVRPGNLIKALEERDDYVLMGTYRDDESEEGHIYSWVISALNYVQKKRIPVKGVNAMIYAEMPLIQGGAQGELFTSDFSDALPLHSFGDGGQVNPAGVTIKDDIAHFGVYGNSEPGIWSFGRKRKNRVFALNYDYRLSPTVGGSTVAEIGAIEMVNGQLLASWKTTETDSSAYGIDQLSSTTRASAVYEGLEFDNGEPHLKRTYNLIKLLMQPMPSGTSVSTKYKLDYEDSWRYAIMGDGSTTHAVSEGYHSTVAHFNIGDAGMPFEVAVELNPLGTATPNVKSIVTYVDSQGQDYA